VQRTQVSDGDLLFFGADSEQVVNDALGALRVRLGHDLDQVEDGWQPLWVIDFPLVERDRESGRWQSAHHPFTAPRDEDVGLLEHDPGVVRARAYDMVLNGSEIGGGSIRIHRSELQESVFKTLGIDRDDARRKFGFLLEALRYGAPPHGGIAFGLDRIVSMMAGEGSIREVIAFPKTQRSACLMTEAPSSIENDQLRELGIRTRSPAYSAERTG
jgi:aspartyl-tRNA synthetase